jgi:EmrB/QacA subfamily drug resistance transporter
MKVARRDCLPDTSSGSELPKHIVVPLIVACALFMQQLDATALATSLPAISAAFGEPAVKLHLAITVYVFSLAAFLPISGWAADRFGARTVFRVAIAIFALASVGCGLATNLEWLVGARIFQGIGAAMMGPVARLILVRSVEKRQLIRALALMSIPGLVGPMVGPLVGGFLTSYASWRWIFWINVPVGIVGILLVTLFIEDIHEEPRRLDLVGAFLSSFGLSAFLFGIDAATTADALGAFSVGCLTSGAVALIAYALHARRSTAPILDLGLFRVATFRASLIGGSLFRIGLGALPFVLPLLLQERFGYTPFQSGLVTFVSAVGSLGMRTISSRVLGRFGFRSVLRWDGLVAAAFTGACSFFRPDTPYIVMILVLFFGGFFRSLQMVSVNALIFADLKHAQMSHATSLSTMAQRLSQSIGVALAAFVLHAATVDTVPSQDGFMLTFAMIAAMAIASSLFFIGLSPEAGAELAGRKSSAEEHE